MTNNSFRNSLGLASLSALALVMVACGGSSSSSTPATPTNAAPSAPVIVGPTTAITLHPAFYNLSAVDPEGSAVTFTVTGTGFTGAGNTATLNATAAGTATVTVVAKDSLGATSTASTLAVQVAANRAPQFVSQLTGQLTGSSSTINWTNFQVSAQDPDTDDVTYSITGTPTFTANDGTAVTGGAVAINATTGVVSFTGTVPSGKTSVTASFTVSAVDKLPGSGTVLGATTTATVNLTFFSSNLPPVIQTTSLPSVPQNHGLAAYQLLATDPNAGDTLTWALDGSTNPAGLALTSAGVMTWPAASNNRTAGASLPVSVKVTDSGGLVARATLNLNIGVDTKPNFVTQTYTETVGGVQFFDPSRVRQSIDSRLKFNWLDTEATQGEFYSDSNNTIKGWRANVLASDAENDAVTYSVKTNSVFRFGVPYVVPTAANYPGVDANTGEIKWTPNRGRHTAGALGDLSLTTGSGGPLGHDPNNAPAAANDSLINVLDPANWSFTIVAQQVIDGVATAGQFNETTLVIKVEPNDRPYQGPATQIWKTTTTLADVLAGVYYNGGSAVATVGRPQIQEPLASDNATPLTPASKWIWVVGTPGGANFASTAARNDYGLFDPNTQALDGHMDAIKVDFGYRAETDDHLVNGALTGLVSGTHYPTLDTTGNLPVVDTANSLTNGFYNPWITTAATSPGNMIVSWAPVRIQYTLGRYIGQSAYKFGLVSEDQYGRMNKGEKSVFPIFGTVFMFNSRYAWLGDTAGLAQETPLDAAPRGGFVASGNTTSMGPALDQAYVFSYLPKGISNSGVTYVELVSVAATTTATYGANLFGQSDGAGNYASGYPGGNAPALPAAATNYYNSTAGAWMTLDGVNAGIFGTWQEPYPANPLNVLLNPASRAAANIGTSAGASGSYVQFKGGAPDGTGGTPVQVNVTVSGPYADNTVKAKVVPSNSPYDFFLNNADTWTSKGLITNLGTGYVTKRFVNVPQQGNDSSTTLRHYSGQPQSEVNYAQILPGRAVNFSVANEAAANVGDNASGAVGIGVGQIDVQAPRLRISYTWPTIVTNTATGYPTAGTANIFAERDVMQIATPNLSGNARFFFTGNYPSGIAFSGAGISIANGQERGVDATDPNFFGKFGLTGGTDVAASVAQTGVITAITAPYQPLHVVTDSIWIPNNADLKFNFPSAYTTPAGGSGYTDIPFVGIKGYLNRAANNAAPLNLPLNANDMNPMNTSSANAWLQVGITTALSPSGNSLDYNANPALLSTTAGDRIFAVWLKGIAAAPNAYAAWGGSQLIAGSSLVAKGGITTAPAFAMSGTAGALTDTQAQISFATLNGQLGATNQALGSSTSLVSWKRNEFELLGNVMGAPAQFGLAGRVRLVDPTVPAALVAQTGTAFDTAATATADGLVQNSLVVYGVRDRGTKSTQNGATYSNRLGEAGLEPGSPVIAQWWNTGNGDIAVANFPDVMKAYATEWLPSDFTEVVAIKHSFVGKIQAPGTAATDLIQKVYLEQGLIAPKGHALLSAAEGVKPVVSPVRQLAINDLVNNYANGSLNVGTKLDIFNGNAVTLATGAQAATAPSYKLVNGNATADWTLNGYSNLQLSWQPAVNDLRHPSGYIVTVYRVTTVGAAPATTTALPIQEFRVGHIGGIGAIQTLNLPTLVAMSNESAVPANGTTAAYAIKVRNVWMEGTEGAAGHSFDMGKEPWATRFPTAYADCLSGVFVGRF